MTDTFRSRASATPRWLGYGGLLPFLILAPASLLDHVHGELWSHALYAYGAIILTFVGALHWSIAMVSTACDDRTRRRAYGWSVVPALLAWPAVLLTPLDASLVLVAGFVAHYRFDRRLAGEAGLPAWYLPLRFRLTTVACLCLLAGAFVEFR